MVGYVQSRKGTPTPHTVSPEPPGPGGGCSIACVSPDEPLPTRAIWTPCAFHPSPQRASLQLPLIHPSNCVSQDIPQHLLCGHGAGQQGIKIANKPERTSALKLLALQQKETDSKIKQSAKKVVWAGLRAGEEINRTRGWRACGEGRTGKAFVGGGGGGGHWGETGMPRIPGVDVPRGAAVGEALRQMPRAAADVRRCPVHPRCTAQGYCRWA
ncbi:hypothetical protein HJG60_011862 [Phyllostomus discolor]|uniref:Uncharacterized protein n=1 Tax=Phyllostomus discolor TaxID=89673 RepID=A0A833ZJ37_9CHIR|nr:hypothetical protein HJG60_011862 [Phyllostomus discolor]